MTQRSPRALACTCLTLLAIALTTACSSSKTASSTTRRAVTTTTTRAPATTTTTQPAVAPLTGLADPTGQTQSRPALTVKIENTTAARPQWGIEEADVVYEEVVEGGITRYAVIFQSHLPARVGPIRSVRRTDQSIVWPIGGVFAYSGGAAYAVQSIKTAPVHLVDETGAGTAMFRDRSRAAPHNLYGHADALVAKGGSPAPPPALFTYRDAAAAPSAGTPATHVRVGFSAGYATTWDWDAASGTWQRSIFGKPDVMASGARLAPANVVIQFVNYIGGTGNVGAEGQLTGEGAAWVLTGGQVVKGRWVRPDKQRPAQLLDETGNEIALAPGQTWVELPAAGYTVDVTP